MDQRINFFFRALGSTIGVTAGAEMAGVHVLLGARARRPGSYHIGASGLFLNEVLVRTLGETVERYAQMTAVAFGLIRVLMCSFRDMQERHAGATELLSERDLELFDPASYRRERFPYKRFEPDAALGWVEMESLLTRRRAFVPAQFVLVGYRPQQSVGEASICSSVTTGTAAHRTPERALANALLELVQIDAAVGHWYTRSPCFGIQPDDRTVTVHRIIAMQRGDRLPCPMPEFIYLPNPDLPGLTVACLLRGPSGSLPEVAVGLGCDLALGPAMYKAWLEALGVWGLGSVNMIECRTASHVGTSLGDDPIFDLDSNVERYARGGAKAVFNDRFSPKSTTAASDLPSDFTGSPSERVQYLLDGFRKSGKRLYRLDLTTPDVADLGFFVERVWSPDTLSLPLPSAPQHLHRRFTAYGGLAHESPHPYP